MQAGQALIALWEYIYIIGNGTLLPDPPQSRLGTLTQMLA